MFNVVANLGEGKFLLFKHYQCHFSRRLHIFRTALKYSRPVISCWLKISRSSDMRIDILTRNDENYYAIIVYNSTLNEVITLLYD